MYMKKAHKSFEEIYADPLIVLEHFGPEAINVAVENDNPVVFDYLTKKKGQRIDLVEPLTLIEYLTINNAHKIASSLEGNSNDCKISVLAENSLTSVLGNDSEE